MQVQSETTQENHQESASNSASSSHLSSEGPQGQHQQMANNSPQVMQMKAVQQMANSGSSSSGVVQFGKKKEAIKAAKEQKGGVKHHVRPEYQAQNNAQMALIQTGMSRKEAKRQAKAQLKDDGD